LAAPFLLLAGAAVAADPPIDPRADEVMRRMSDYMRGLKSFRVHTESSDEAVTTKGEKIDFMASSHLTVRRPDRLRDERSGPLADVVVRYDGQSLSLFEKSKGFYAQVPAPATLDGTIDMAQAKYSIDAPAADLLRTDPYKDLMDGVRSGRYIGMETVNGVRCHHIAFRGATADWQLWVQDGPQPLPLRYSIDSIDQKGRPQFTVMLTGWEPNVAVADDEFKFAPPPEAKRIDILKTAKAKKEGER
jgi:hypothetical protein